MAVKLRLMRMGKKKQPTYRVVVADSRKARNGRIIEAVGFYDPRRDPSVIEIDNEKAIGWLRNGAQPTERVEKLLKISGAWDEFKGQSPAPKVETAATEEAPAEEAVPEEAVPEEAPAEEAVAEEAVADEAPADEAPVEEAVAEATEDDEEQS